MPNGRNLGGWQERKAAQRGCHFQQVFGAGASENMTLRRKGGKVHIPRGRAQHLGKDLDGTLLLPDLSCGFGSQRRTQPLRVLCTPAARQ